MAYGQTGPLQCSNCWPIYSGGPCTFNNIADCLELKTELKAFESLRQHVPCHNCWEEGKERDNNLDTCSHCANEQIDCIRQACENFQEPGDDAHCRNYCDKAHLDDGYTNVVHDERSKDGFNARQLQQRVAREGPDDRVAVCESCYKRGWDQICDLKEPCECTRVHATQGLGNANLKPSSTRRPNKKPQPIPKQLKEICSSRKEHKGSKSDNDSEYLAAEGKD